MEGIAMEKGNRRFGTYLKSLRRQRRLTLERIEELSARMGEPISKTYLSRCEHGEASPALPRLNVLARLYRVRFGELAERYEIEREISRTPALSDDDGLDPAEAAEKAIEAAGKEDPSRALLLFDAARKFRFSPIRSAPSASRAAGSPSSGRIAEARSRLCLAVLSGAVGNDRVCKEEAEAVAGADDLPEEIRLRACVHLAQAYRRLRRSSLARLVVRDLLSREESLPRRLQADAHFLMGSLELDAACPRPALLHLRKAVSLYRSAGCRAELARCLLELGESYRLARQIPEAMSRYQEALAIARRADIKSLVSNILSHLGRGHVLVGNISSALKNLFESNDLARRGEQNDILFRNYFYLREISRQRKDEFSRRTAERSLRILLPRCDGSLEEAVLYRREAPRKEAADGRARGESGAALSGGRLGARPVPRPPAPPRYSLRASQESTGPSRYETDTAADRIVRRPASERRG